MRQFEQGWLSWAAAWRAASTTSTPGTSDSSRQPGQGRPPKSLNGSRILDGAAAAALTSARSFAAIAEWATDTPANPGRARRPPRPTRRRPPGPTETTIRRTLGRRG
jgi:hypothetical protein